MAGISAAKKSEIYTRSYHQGHAKKLRGAALQSHIYKALKRAGWYDDKEKTAGKIRSS